ncbi:hypothetical protein LTR27_010401 [Elasticomyces elasticus]|nr:hypothetical protein LTR27_010401 [Elasticomyces elasticus]
MHNLASLDSPAAEAIADLRVRFSRFSSINARPSTSSSLIRDCCTKSYENGNGRFQANYFKTDLRSRGLVDGYGPALKHFPFYEDASRLHDAVSTFMQSFVDSYYSSDDEVMADKELQAWAKEANGDAGVHDFPEEFSSKQTLVDALTHRLTVGALFARPKSAGSTRTILHMFDGSSLLARMNSQTRSAAATFMDTMRRFSSEVSSRTFDAAGLSQGMPFVWQALDPNLAPYSVTT